MKHLRQTHDRIARLETVVARIATDLIERIRSLTIDINALEGELDERLLRRRDARDDPTRGHCPDLVVVRVAVAAPDPLWSA